MTKPSRIKWSSYILFWVILLTTGCSTPPDPPQISTALPTGVVSDPEIPVIPTEVPAIQPTNLSPPYPPLTRHAPPTQTPLPIAAYPIQPSPTPAPTNTALPPTASPTLEPTPIPYPQYAGLLLRVTDDHWVIQEDGSLQQVTGQFPAGISPDGYLNLYEWLGDMWITDLRSGEKINLSNTKQRRECCPRWWPANPNLIICESHEDLEENFFTPYYLTTIDLLTREYQVLDSEHRMGSASLSSDGNLIAYGAGWVYDLQKKSSTQLAPADYGFPDFRLLTPAWSPSGELLAWTAISNVNDQVIVGTLILDLSSQSAIGLHFFNPVGTDARLPAPAWHPSGTWLVINGFATNYEQAGLWIFPVTGQPGEEFRLEPHAGSMVTKKVAWSPKGEYLAVTIRNMDTSQIYIYQTGIWQPQELILNQSFSVAGWIDLASD